MRPKGEGPVDFPCPRKPKLSALHLRGPRCPTLRSPLSALLTPAALETISKIRPGGCLEIACLPLASQAGFSTFSPWSTPRGVGGCFGLQRRYVLKVPGTWRTMNASEWTRKSPDSSSCVCISLVELFPPGGLGWKVNFYRSGPEFLVVYFRGRNIHLESMEILYENPGMAWDGVDEVGLLENILWSEMTFSLHLVDAVRSIMESNTQTL